MSIQIIIDSTCDLPQEILKKYSIRMLPFNVHIGDKTYKDRVNIKVEEVYKHIREGIYPKTSQVSPGDIRDAFVEYAKKGIDCIYISISSKLSGAYQTARVIAEKVQQKYSDSLIRVVDSKGGSVGAGIIAYKAAMLIEKGCKLNFVVDKVKSFAEHIEHLLVVDDLKCLQRGGRVSKSSSFICDVLNIKPLLHIVDGEIELLKKVRGSKKAINTLVSYFKKRSCDIKNQLIGIAHADDMEKANYLKDKIKEMGGKVFCIEQISSGVGAHIGIGGLGLFFLNRDD